MPEKLKPKNEDLGLEALGISLETNDELLFCNIGEWFASALERASGNTELTNSINELHGSFRSLSLFPEKEKIVDDFFNKLESFGNRFGKKEWGTFDLFEEVQHFINCDKS